MAYERNEVTSACLADHGMEVAIIGCSELGRARGGPGA